MHLDYLQHHHWRFTPIDNRLLAARQPTLTVTAADISALHQHLPIVLPPTPDQLPQALQVPSDCQHSYGHYLPSLWRYYPFYLVEQGNILDAACQLQRHMTVQFDADAGHFAQKHGYPLFNDHGQPAPLLQETLIGLSQQQGEIAQTLRLIQCLAEAGALKPATVRHGVALIDCCLIDPEGLGEKLERIPEEYRHQAALLADLLLHAQSHLQAQGELYLTPYQVDPAQHSQRRAWGFRPQWGR